MKIRLNNNTIRIRLSREELSQLEKEGKLKETVVLPKGKEIGVKLLLREMLMVSSTEGLVKIQLDKEKTQQWIACNELSNEEKLKLETGEILRVLIEKDIHHL